VREYRSTAGALPCVEFAAAATAWAGALAKHEGPCTLEAVRVAGPRHEVTLSAGRRGDTLVVTFASN
ncbi:MAG: hypothetical protein M3173_00540, partial [Chloroflexota bacterium]|nr:hypothetical protein [Chloroflexota bacterium]